MYWLYNEVVAHIILEIPSFFIIRSVGIFPIDVV